MDKISIIVPVFNAENFISNCVNSLINQTYSNIEIILIDDESTDNSLSICNNLKNKDSRISVYSIKNSGAFKARITGVKKSTGSFVTFIDCDDYVDEDYIEYLYKLIKSDDYSISCCQYQLSRESGKISIDNQNEVLNIYNFDLIIKNLYVNKLWSMCLKLYDRSLFTDSILDLDINLSVSEDFLCNYYIYKNVFSKDSKIICSNLQKYYYFRHSDSVMAQSISSNRLEDSIKAYNIVYNDFDKNAGAYNYYLCHKLDNDFLNIHQIIEHNSCWDYFDEIRNDAIACYKEINELGLSNQLSFKRTLQCVLLKLSPTIYKFIFKHKG